MLCDYNHFIANSYR